MAEYWKSTPKYWCKHCSTYVKDTSFERKQHESTGKHQGNLKRFLRDIQNSHERDEREKERAKSEVERLSRIAGGGSHALSNPTTTQSQTKPPSTRNQASGPPAAAELKRQWAQLAEMGIKVPEQARSEMAMPGEWQTVEQKPTTDVATERALNIGVRKRKVEDQEEDEEAEEAVANRGWGSATKRYPGDDKSDLDDLLSNTISLKKERIRPPSQLKDEEKDSLTLGCPKEGDKGIVKDENREHIRDESALKDGNPVKGETDAAQSTPSLANIPEEVPLPVFKKRKAKAS